MILKFCLLPSTFILPSIAPARNRTWTSSFARSRGHPFHHGDASFVIHDFGLRHSAGHIPARTRTRNAAFEAPHDHPFQHGDDFSLLLASRFSLLDSSKECPYLRRPPRLEPQRRVPRLHRRTPSSPALAQTGENRTNKKPRRPSGLRGLLSVIGPRSSSSPGIRAPIAIKRIAARNLKTGLAMAGR